MVSDQACLKCGSCRVGCPFRNISWALPRGGYGVADKLGEGTSMQPSSIEQIDRAALVLPQALGEHRKDLARHFEPGHLDGLDGLEADLIMVRQALLGLEMGPLDWDALGGEVEQVGGKDTRSDVSAPQGSKGSEPSGSGGV